MPATIAFDNLTTTLAQAAKVCAAARHEEPTEALYTRLVKTRDDQIRAAWGYDQTAPRSLEAEHRLRNLYQPVLAALRHAIAAPPCLT